MSLSAPRATGPHANPSVQTRRAGTPALPPPLTLVDIKPARWPALRRLLCSLAALLSDGRPPPAPRLAGITYKRLNASAAAAINDEEVRGLDERAELRRRHPPRGSLHSSAAESRPLHTASPQGARPPHGLLFVNDIFRRVVTEFAVRGSGAGARLSERRTFQAPCEPMRSRAYLRRMARRACTQPPTA
eukprot:38385-Prymnesium_polylepis.2